MLTCWCCAHRDHPGAALPGQRDQRVLVPRRLRDLQHHLVALQLRGDGRGAGAEAGPAAQPAARHQAGAAGGAAVALDVAAAVVGVLHAEAAEVFLLL